MTKSDLLSLLMINHALIESYKGLVYVLDLYILVTISSTLLP